MTSPHPDPSAWVSLAKGWAEAEERSALLAHAEACPGCARERASLEAGLSRIAAAAPAAMEPPPLAPLPPRARAVPLWLFRPAAAAAILLAAGAAVLHGTGLVGGSAGEILWVRGEARGLRAGDRIPRGREIEAAEGAVVGVRLAGGAEAVLRSGARVSALSGRSVRLDAGEIHVRAPARARGFSVETAQGRLVDLGTAFLARTDGGGTTAIVIAGAVRAESGGASGRLKRGERAVLDGRAPPVVEAAPPADVDRALGWVREALLPARAERMEAGALLDLIEQTSALTFEVDRAALRGVTVTASLGSASSEEAANGVLRALGWRFERDGWRVKVFPPARPGGP